MQQGRIDANAETVKLDVKDQKILKFLCEDSRAPLSKVSKKVALSRDAVDYRIKRLQEKNIILKFVPRINYRKLGYYSFHAFFLLSEASQKEQNKFIEFLKQHNAVHSIVEYSDKWDLEVVFIAKELEMFDKIIMDVVNKFPDLIVEKDRIATTHVYFSHYIPHMEKMDVKPIKRKHEETVKLDKKDIAIIKILGENCRQSTYEIGKKIGLSADAIGYRMKRLKETGVIERFSILVNLSALNYNLYTFPLQVRKFDDASESKFKAFASKHESILKAVKTLGSWSVITYIVSNSPQNFHKTVKEIKSAFSDIITNYETWVAYKEHQYTAFPPILEQR